MILQEKYRELADEAIIESISKLDDINLKTVLFNRYKDKIYGICLKYLANQEEAKDALMSIYELFVRKIGLHKVDNFNAWIYTMSRNYCFDYLRKRNRQAQKEEKYLDEEIQIQYHPFEIDEDLQQIRLILLKKCMDALKSEQRKVIQLFYMQKLSYQEISDSMSLSWSRIRSLIQNARLNLKKCMKA